MCRLPMTGVAPAVPAAPRMQPAAPPGPAPWGPRPSPRAKLALALNNGGAGAGGGCGGGWVPPKGTLPRALPPLPSSMVGSATNFYREAVELVRQKKLEDPLRLISARRRTSGIAEGLREWDHVQSKYLVQARVAHPPRGSLPSRRGAPASAPEGAVRAFGGEAAAAPADASPAPQRGAPTAAEVVEAPTSVDVVGEDGEVHRIPPYAWLVLAPGASLRALRAEVPGEPAAETPKRPVGVGELRLSKEAGGGTLRENGVQLLQLVGQDRLHARAAEANFRRVSRRASLAALRHAAVVLRLFGQQEPQADPDFRCFPDARDELPLSQAEVAARLKCAEDLVVFRAAAAEKLRKMPSRSGAGSQRGAQYGGGSGRGGMLDADGSTPSSSSSSRKSVMQRGWEAYEEFSLFARRRFGNAIRLYFEIDPEETMRVGAMQFARACEEIGYRGNVSTLWRYLDKDNSGQITLQDLDSKATAVLADFKLWVQEKFDDSTDKLMRAVDDNGRNRVTKVEFVDSLQKCGFPGSTKTIKRLFDLLQRRAGGIMTMEDITFLEKWHPPLYLLCKPDADSFEVLKKELEDKCWSLLRVWLKFLDRKRDMRVNWEDWCATLPKLQGSSSGSSSIAITEKQLAMIWRTLDEDCSGWIALREFDPESSAVLEKAKRWLDRHHGGMVSKGLLAATAYRSGVYEEKKTGVVLQASRAALRSILRKEGGLTRDEIDLLLDALDIKEGAGVTEADLKFLEKWDLVWEHQLFASGARGVAAAATFAAAQQKAPVIATLITSLSLGQESLAISPMSASSAD